jgi:hypothetical protein
MHERTNIQLNRPGRSKLEAVVANRNSPQKPIFDDVVATLTSPRIKHKVAVLAGAILRAPAGTMSAVDVLERIILAMAAALPVAADQTAHPRKIFVR